MHIYLTTPHKSLNRCAPHESKQQFMCASHIFFLLAYPCLFFPSPWQCFAIFLSFICFFLKIRCAKDVERILRCRSHKFRILIICSLHIRYFSLSWNDITWAKGTHMSACIPARDRRARSFGRAGMSALFLSPRSAWGLPSASPPSPSHFGQLHYRSAMALLYHIETSKNRSVAPKKVRAQLCSVHMAKFMHFIVFLTN